MDPMDRQKMVMGAARSEAGFETPRPEQHTAALETEAIAGRRLATRAILAGLVVIAGWLLIQLGWERVWFYEVILALFALIFFADYRLGVSRFARPWHPYLFVALGAGAARLHPGGAEPLRRQLADAHAAAIRQLRLHDGVPCAGRAQLLAAPDGLGGTLLCGLLGGGRAVGARIGRRPSAGSTFPRPRVIRRRAGRPSPACWASTSGPNSLTSRRESKT